MEEQDLNKILLKDSEYYDPKAIYVQALKRHNITTVQQLFDIDVNVSQHRGTRKQLRAFILMLKHKYLGEPLLYDAFLDDTVKFYSVFFIVGTDKYLYADNCFGCNSSHIIDVIEAFAKEHSKNLGEPFEIKLIDFFRWIINNSKEIITRHQSRQIIEYAKTYVEEYEKQHQLTTEEYEKQHQLTAEEYETIQFLRGQLDTLVRIREDLDLQIKNIEENIARQIEALSSKETKGGIKR